MVALALPVISVRLEHKALRVPKVFKVLLAKRVILAFKVAKENQAKKVHKVTMVHKAHKVWKGCLVHREQRVDLESLVHQVQSVTLVHRGYQESKDSKVPLVILVYKVFKESLVCLDPKDLPVRWDFPVRLAHKVSRGTVAMMVLTAKTVPLVNQAYRVKRVSPVYRESKAILVNEET